MRGRTILTGIAGVTSLELGLLHMAIAGDQAVEQVHLHQKFYGSTTSPPWAGLSESPRQLQAAQMIGGRPPKSVQLELCDIQSVFSSLSEIISYPACRIGCEGGSGVCADPWYPGATDSCNAECGAVFEPFCKISPPPSLTTQPPADYVHVHNASSHSC